MASPRRDRCDRRPTGCPEARPRTLITIGRHSLDVTDVRSPSTLQISRRRRRCPPPFYGGQVLRRADDLGPGKDQYGPRMGRALELAKRVADPDDAWTYRNARHAMRPRKSEKGLRKDRKRAKKSTVAKNKKSA